MAYALRMCPTLVTFFQDYTSEEAPSEGLARHHQMPGRSWRAWKAIVAMESPKALMCPLEKGVRGIKIGASEK